MLHHLWSLYSVSAFDFFPVTSPLFVLNLETSSFILCGLHVDMLGASSYMSHIHFPSDRRNKNFLWHNGLGKRRAIRMVENMGQCIRLDVLGTWPIRNRKIETTEK